MKNKTSSSKLNFLYEKNVSVWRQESVRIANKEENLANLLNLNPKKYSYSIILNIFMFVFWAIFFFTAVSLIVFSLKSIFANDDVFISVFVIFISFYGSLALLRTLEHYSIGVLLCFFIRLYDVESHITQGVRMVGRVTEIKENYEMNLKVKNGIIIKYTSKSNLHRKYNYKNTVPIIEYKNRLLFL